jgi:hypothetical protein
MGDRRMPAHTVVEIKTSNGSLYVYSHWGGSELPGDAVEAILAARSRWDDEPYATRIIVDQLTKGSRDKATDHGLTLRPNAEDGYNLWGPINNPSIIIDLESRTLQVVGDGAEHSGSFDEIG